MATLHAEISIKTGETITIRTFTEEDFEEFLNFQIQITKETTHTLQMEGRHPTKEKCLEFWKTHNENPRALMLGAFKNNEVIGCIGLYKDTPHPWTDHIAKFGMMILQRYWGSGLSKELMNLLILKSEEFGFQRLEATVRTKNERGVKFYKNYGFEIEGTRRNAAIINGESQDEYYIAKHFCH